MKRKIIYLVISILLLIHPLFLNSIFADQPPDPGGGPGSGDPPVGGGSPIGSGMVIMLSMAIGYGTTKVLKVKKF